MRTLLRRYRLAAGLSQEALAERAGMSVRGVSDLERPATTTISGHTGAAGRCAGLGPDERAALRAARNAADPELAESPGSLTSKLGPELQQLRRSSARAHAYRATAAEAPLVTLAGPGGAGKTRLAARVCREVDGTRETVVVELAPVSHAVLVPRAVTAALGVTDDSRQPLGSRLANALGAGHLLVLDNCEHVVDACAELVDTLLRDCPGLHVLATSREPLGIEGEAVFRVPPLGLPAADDVQACAESEAVQLFVQRVRAARNDSSSALPTQPCWPACADSWTVCRWASSSPRRT